MNAWLAMQCVDAVLTRHRVRYGLGVGSPDLFGAVRGVMFGIELKSERGRLSAGQRQWHAAARL
jgi:hypothetical protein